MNRPLSQTDKSRAVLPGPDDRERRSARSLGWRLKWRVFGGFLNVVYAGLLLVLSPVLFDRMLRQGKYRHGWGAKLFGRLPQLPPVEPQAPPRYWFHAVSVGEVLLLRTVIDGLKQRIPGVEIVISTTTHTGHAVAVEKYPEARICWFPLDFTWAVRNAIARIQPTRIVLAELELWPNFLLAAAASGVPVTLINGRLSEKSHRGYGHIRWLMRTLFQSFDAIAAQNPQSAERFIDLGANPDRVVMTGSVKFDGLATDRSNPRTSALRKIFELHPGDTVFVAGSTQSPEEQVAIDAWQTVRQRHPQLRLVLVPRHQERFDEVARLVLSNGLPLLRRSTGAITLPTSSPAKGRPSHPTTDQAAPLPVLLLDTLGELSACWGLADLAFVGGSFCNRGGQNMIEPAAYGATVCFGPNTRNFRHVVESLLIVDGAVVVTPETMTHTLQSWLDNRSLSSELGQRARDFVLSQSGASRRTVDLLTGCQRRNQESAPSQAAHQRAA